MIDMCKMRDVCRMFVTIYDDDVMNPFFEICAENFRRSLYIF